VIQAVMKLSVRMTDFEKLQGIPLRDRYCSMFAPPKTRDVFIDAWARTLSPLIQNYNASLGEKFAQLANLNYANTNQKSMPSKLTLVEEINVIKGNLKRVSTRMDVLFQLNFAEACDFMRAISDIETKNKWKINKELWQRGAQPSTFQLKAALEAPWELRKSRSELGWWYFYNPETGVRTWEPWFPKKSETANEYNYINVFTREFSRHPPTDRWAQSAAFAGNAKPMLRPARERPVKLMLPLPFPYFPASSHGRVYFYNELTKKSFWSPWFRASSTQRPGAFYYFNVLTGESVWDGPKEWQDVSVPTGTPVDEAGNDLYPDIVHHPQAPEPPDDYGVFSQRGQVVSGEV